MLENSPSYKADRLISNTFSDNKVNNCFLSVNTTHAELAEVDQTIAVIAVISRFTCKRGERVNSALY